MSISGLVTRILDTSILHLFHLKLLVHESRLVFRQWARAGSRIQMRIKCREDPSRSTSPLLFVA